MRGTLVVRILALILMFSPLCAHAAPSSIDEFIIATDCLDYFTYLKNHRFYNLNQENTKIYSELKTKNESNIESFTNLLFSEQSMLDLFVKTSIKSKKIVLLPVVSEFKRRALAQNQKAAYEKLSELESSLTQDAEKTSGVTSFLAYMKNLGPTEKEINQNAAVPADVAALIEYKGPFIGGLYNALGDALAYLKQYRIAIEFKEKAIKNFNPASSDEYLFLSEIEKDIALYNYILSDPSAAAKQDSPDHGFFGQALSYILRSIVSLEKANGPSVLLAYRQLFQLRFLYETGRYPEALKILDQVAASESFKTDFAIVGALLLTGFPGGLSEEQHHRLDDFVKTILADQERSNPTDPLGSHMALLRYFGLKGDWLRFIEQQRKTKELLDTLKPNGDLEMRLSKFYRKDLQPNAEYADYGDADGVLYDKIGDLLRAGKNREALLACEEFIAKYPLSFYYDGVLAAYANCLWGIVTEDIEKYYHMPDWRPGDPSYDAYVADLTSYFPRASNLRKYLESHAGPSNPPYLLPSCWVGLGIFYWYAYQPELSVECSKKAYEIDTGAYVDNRPASLEWVSLGYTLWAYQTSNQDYLTAAIQAGKDVLKLFPKYKRIEPVTLNLAANYLFTKQYDNLRSLLASSKNPLGVLLIARRFQESGNLADAEKTYRGVLAGTFPSANAKLAYYPMAFLGLMDTLIGQGKLNDAFLLADTFKLDTSQAAANFRKFYDRWVRMHQAGVEVRKWQARSLMPGFTAEGRAGLEKLCSQTSYPDETAYVSTNTDVPLEAMFTTYPDPSNGKPLYYNLEFKFINRFRDDAMFYIGESYEKEGDFDQASVWYQKVIDTFRVSNSPTKSVAYFYFQIFNLDPTVSIISPLFSEFVEKAKSKLGVQAVQDSEKIYVNLLKTGDFPILNIKIKGYIDSKIQLSYIDPDEPMIPNDYTANYGVNWESDSDGKDNAKEKIVDIHYKDGFITGKYKNTSINEVIDTLTLDIKKDEEKIIKFQTSTFGGDNYQIIIKNIYNNTIIKLPIVTVWRKYYFEFDEMKRISYDQDKKTYKVYFGDDYFDWLKNIYKPAYIEIEKIPINNQPVGEYKEIIVVSRQVV